MGAYFLNIDLFPLLVFASHRKLGHFVTQRVTKCPSFLWRGNLVFCNTAETSSTYLLLYFSTKASSTLIGSVTATLRIVSANSSAFSAGKYPLCL